MSDEEFLIMPTIAIVSSVHVVYWDVIRGTYVPVRSSFMLASYMCPTTNHLSVV